MTVKATLTAARFEAEQIADLLERDYGDSGVAVSLSERPDGLWSVDGYFEGVGKEEARDMLGLWLDGVGVNAELKVETLPEIDWVAKSLEGLKPVMAGRFVVHGGHDRGRFAAGRIAIEIDAGQAFGTGHHATTAGCLTVLDRLTRTRRFERILDLGTGSGVLAIALAKTLRRPVLATDIDPVSVRVARENARLNGVGGLVECVAATGVEHAAIRSRAPFDLVVANILAEPLMRLAPSLAPLVARGGVLVLSGLLPRQRERVVAAYGVQHVRLQEARVLDGWSVLVLRRSGGRSSACVSARASGP
jgi:ribosomal protein L11 methyltransferase